MIGTLVDIASWALISAGSVFVLIGAVGLIRLPDIYTRMHAASVIDTLGAALMLSGFILQAGFTLITVKLLFLLLLFFYTTPVVAHALAQAALQEGVEPILSEDRREARKAEILTGENESGEAS